MLGGFVRGELGGAQNVEQGAEQAGEDGGQRGMPERAVSVSELNAYIKSARGRETAILGSVAVRGELSNYKVYPSGHHYFTLKDSESALRCVMFRYSASKLRFRPESGMGVVVCGRVSVYPRDGAYQLYCRGHPPGGQRQRCSWPTSSSRRGLKRKGFSTASTRNPYRATPSA